MRTEVRSPLSPRALAAAALVLIALAIYIVYALARSLPSRSLTVAPATAALSTPRAVAPLAWPVSGAAALAVEGVATVGVHGSGAPGAIASVAKVMTAYVVLAAHPLAPGEQGPSLRVSAADAAAYRRDAAEGQSVLPVRAGERLSELDALEGLLLPSGNNVAVLLARWDAGSERAFVAKMNATAGSLGLTHTLYTSASGLESSTVSTAADQLRLAEVAFRVPVFRQIVAMPEAILPVAGPQYNVDALLGHDGIVGIKTGTTTSAGGCFVFAARVPEGRREITVIGVVLHQPGSDSEASLLAAAFQATTSLLHSMPDGLRVRTLLRRGETLATLTAPWSQSVPLTAGRRVRVLLWRGIPIHASIPSEEHMPASFAAGKVVGVATLKVGTRLERVPLVAKRGFGGASIGWRLTHP